MIDLKEDSKVEMVDTLFRRKDSYFAFEDGMGHCKPRNASTAAILMKVASRSVRKSLAGQILTE